MLAGGCGSRYRAAECPGDALPEAKELLAQPGFDRLRYFRGTDHRSDRVDYETWADNDFDFTVSLNYHYPALDGRRRECARGVTLTVRRPASDANKALQSEFVRVFAGRLGTDLRAMAVAASEYESRQGDVFLVPQRFEAPPLVGEVVGVGSYHRGDFVTIGFFDRAYDEYRQVPP